MIHSTNRVEDKEALAGILLRLARLFYPLGFIMSCSIRGLMGVIMSAILCTVTYRGAKKRGKAQTWLWRKPQSQALF